MGNDDVQAAPTPSTAPSARRRCAWLIACALSTSAVAQTKLPPPSRTVYKCVVDGKTVYGDAPCLGAVKVDVEPTRGLDQATGRQRIGADVQRERQREALAEALRPLTGMDAAQLDRQGRRARLAPPVRAACARLDDEIRDGEAREAALRPPDRAPVQRALLAQRQQYRQFGC